MITTTDEKTVTKQTEASVAAAVSSKKHSKTEKPKEKTINSRFGELKVNEANAINFAHGILGVPGKVNFCLADLPDQNTDQFKLLQCLEDEALCFIVVPSQYDNQLLDPMDLDEACRILAIDPESLLVFFIVSVHSEDGVRRLSVNAKAPILVDATRKTGTQYVFQNINYKIRHMIS